MAKNSDFLDGLIESAEDGLKTIHRAASAKGASWSPDDRKALKEWASALSSLTTVKAMREAEERGDFSGASYGPNWPDRAYGPYRNRRMYDFPDYAYGSAGDMGRGGNAGRNGSAYGMDEHMPNEAARRRVIADLTRLRDSAPDEHTRMEYARMLSHEYGVTG